MAYRGFGHPVQMDTRRLTVLKPLPRLVSIRRGSPQLTVLILCSTPPHSSQRLIFL